MCAKGGIRLIPEIHGDADLLDEHKKNGFLLAYLRNVPEMIRLYGKRDDIEGYCFVNGSRGRGNGKVKVSPMGGSNILLGDETQCVIICQEGANGPLRVRVYDINEDISKPRYLGDQVWRIIRQYNLPYVEGP